MTDGQRQEDRHCHRPKAAGAVAEIAGQKTGPITEKLAEAGDDADGGRAHAKRAEEGTGDAARALVCHVAEQADDAEETMKVIARRRGKGSCPAARFMGFSQPAK